MINRIGQSSGLVIKRKRTGKCPVCGCKSDRRVYKADKEQRVNRYPYQFRICCSCYAPFVSA